MLNGDGNKNDKKPNMSYRKKNNFARAAHFFRSVAECRGSWVWVWVNKGFALKN